MISVLVIGGSRCHREAMALALQLEPGFLVLGEGATAAECGVELRACDVVLLVDGFGGPLDIKSIGDVRQMGPGPSVLVLAEHPTDMDRANALEAGASGVLSSTVGVQGVANAIRRLHRGELLHSAREMFDLLRLAGEKRREEGVASAAISSLTPRELEVLQLLAAGKEVSDISEDLFISAETVRTHINRVLTKLRTRTRLQAVLFAARHGVISI